MPNQPPPPAPGRAPPPAESGAGGAVLVVSSELDEILALSDRVLVMDRGRIAGELAIADCTESALGTLMAGAQATAEAAP